MSSEGSGIDFSDIVFSRRYHPPLKKGLSNTVEADFDHQKKQIRIFLAGLKKLGYNTDSEYTYEELERVFTHEVLHGIVEDILTKDGIDYWSYDIHWPYDKGFE